MTDPNVGVHRIRAPMTIGDEHIDILLGPVSSAVFPLTSAIIIIVLGSLSVNRPPFASIDVD